MRASITAEAVGIPTVSIVGSGFVQIGKAVSRALGVSNLRMLEFPGVIMTEKNESFHDKVVESMVDPLIGLLSTRNDAVRR